MGLSTTIFFCVFLCGLGMGQWQGAVAVTHTTKGAYFPTLFTDQSTGATHIFWCENRERDIWQLHYRIQFVNQSFGPTQLLDQHDCRRVWVTGPHNGKQMYVAQQAYRIKYGTGCSESKKQIGGCSDVYFLESEDGGHSWSKAVPVPRDPQNLTDHTMRYGGHIVLQLETGRLWIVYDHGGTSVAMITRAGDSRVFQNERQVTFGQLREYHEVSVAASKDKGRNLLHLTFRATVSKGADVYHTVSADNGNTWATPTKLTTTASNRGSVLLSVPTLFPSHLFLELDEAADNAMKLVVSTDNGNTWPTRLTIYGKRAASPTLAICTTELKTTVLFAAYWGQDNSYIGFGYYQVDTGKFISGPSPNSFSRTANPRISCHQYGRELLAKIVYHAQDSTGWNIYLNTFTLSSYSLSAGS